jgi:nicotinate-nucleotide adenylyltransferase
VSYGERRVGLLGGTFNPVHLGHLTLAQSALETYDLDSVIFIPCRRPPHKEEAPLVSAEHRLAMLDIAIEGDLRFDISQAELEREGPSYTIDTVSWFKESRPNCELFFIIGADTLPELHMWKDIDRLLPMCRFISFERPGIVTEGLTPEKLNLPAPWPEKLLADLSKGVRIEVASSELRYRIAEGFSIRYLVPQQVEMYIAEHSLYQI